MWPESSSVNAVNLAKKITTVPEISNFSQGITFFWRALYIVSCRHNDPHDTSEFAMKTHNVTSSRISEFCHGVPGLYSGF